MAYQRVKPTYLTDGKTFVYVTEHKMCVLIFTTLFFPPETFLIVRIIQRLIVHLHRSSCKVPVILARFLIKLEIS